MTDINEFISRYGAVWNEPDADVRRAAIKELWADDAVEFTESSEFHGQDELDKRVAHAYEEFVRDGGFVFKAADDATWHHDAIRLTVHMVPAGGGEIAWAGHVFILLDGDGRIRTEYQFTVS